VEIRTSQPLFFDSYRINRQTGSFILIDPLTNLTVGAGIIRGPVRSLSDMSVQKASGAAGRHSSNVTWQGFNISREVREKRTGHRAAVLWFTGLSGCGKSTVAKAVEKALFFDKGCNTMMLDGDNVRHGLCGDLGFSDKDRTENIRRVGEAAKLFFDDGAIVLCTFISPLREQREYVRSLIPPERFFEIYVQCDLEICKRRDPKGLYSKALAGEIKDFTGISAPYEKPRTPSITIETDIQSVEETSQNIVSLLQSSGIFSVD
jgi:bifunctional enzyme CysN/CysC